MATEPGRLRIAIAAKPFLGDHVHDDCRGALEDAVRLLVELGHDVTEDAPAFDGEALPIAFVTVVAAEARAELMTASRVVGDRWLAATSSWRLGC